MRLPSPCLVLIAGLLVAAPAAADESGGLPAPLPPAGSVTHRPLGSVAPADRAAELDALFDRLQTADAADAALIERQIEAVWSAPDDAAATLMLGWASRAAQAKQLPLALDCLDQVIARAPRLAEAYYRRASVHYLAGDAGKALDDFSKALGLEPRHFLAIRALAAVMSDLGDDARALDLLERLKALDPHFEGIDAAIEAISPDRRGRDV